MTRMRPPATEPLLGAGVAVGSLGIVAAPIGCLWVASRLGGANGLALAMLGAPAALVAWALVLARLNRSYMNASAHPRKVLEASVTAVVVVAVAAVLIWMLLSGGDVPLRTA